MRTRACHGSDHRVFLQHVDEALGCGLRPTLAVVFCSPTHDFSALSEQLALRGMAVVGATTAGEIVDGTVREESCVALLMEAEPAAFAVQLYPMFPGGSMFALGSSSGVSSGNLG